MNPLGPGGWMRRIEDRLPNQADPRVAIVFWAVAAQVPVLSLCLLLALVAGPPYSLCIVVGLLTVACTSTSLVASGRVKAGARLAIGSNVVLYLLMSPGYGGGGTSPMMASIGVMVLLAALALGWAEALVVSAIGILGHVVLATPAISTLTVPMDPWIYVLSQAAILIEIAMLAGLASNRMYQALVRTTESERSVQAELGLRREAEGRLADALAGAKSASEAKSSFLANMSHELRTPLNAILGYAEILGEEIDPSERHVHDDLGRIVHAGKHLLALINDVLDLSKIEAGRLELVHQVFDVSALVDDLASTTRPLAQQNRNVLHVNAGPGLGELYGDQIRIRQIVLNLLSNASKFTADGTVALNVVRQTNGTGAEELRFEIVDTGIGIAPQTLPRLFQPFVQADNTTSRKYGGTGLGLSLAARLAEMMYGAITVESALGAGSTFRFTLPILSHAGRMAALCHRRIAEAPASGRPAVLCVDDEPAALEVLDRTLAAAGMHAIPVIDPRRALEIARAVRPAVVTLDVRMPEIDGLTLLSQLKADPVLERIPVVMVSIHDDARQGVGLGAADFLPKPIDRARLVTVLGRLARGDGPILVVEDDPETRRILGQTLASAGYEVVECSDGAHALRALEQRRPRAVVLDLMMPEVDGFTVADRMRDDASWATIPIVVVTAADLGPVERVRLAHCVGLYSKSGGLDAVVAEIKKHAA